MARDFHCGFKIAVYVRKVYVRRVVEREGVIKFPAALSRKASVHAAAFSHFSHLCHGEPGSGWAGYWRGWRPRPVLAVCGGCRLKAAFPDRVRRPHPARLARRGKSGAWAGLASAGRSAEAAARGSSRWIKTGAAGPRFRSRALAAGKCRADEWKRLE